MQDVLEPRPRHRGTARVHEDLGRGRRASDRQPRSDRGRDVLPETQLPFLAPLAADENVHVGAVEAEVLHAQPHELGDAQAARECKIDHGPIARALTRRRIGRLEQSPLLLLTEMPDESPVASLRRYRVNATDLVQGRRNAVLEELHERLDRGEPRVARPRSVTSHRLKMDEESGDEHGVELLDEKRGRRLAQPLTREAQEKLERVRVRVTGVRAGAPLYGESLPEEGRQVRGQRCHDARSSFAAHASAMRFIRSGVECRYQKPVATLTCPRYVVTALMCRSIFSTSRGLDSSARTAHV